MNGCLEYGHLGDVTVAEFLGDAAEQASTGNPAEQACRQQVGITNVQRTGAIIEAPEAGWTDEATIYFPSDTKETRDSMLQVAASFGVSKDNDGQLTAFFRYTANRVDGRERATLSE